MAIITITDATFQETITEGFSASGFLGTVVWTMQDDCTYIRRA